MQAQIALAFAALNLKLHNADQAWAIHKLDTVKDFLAQAQVDFKDGKNSFTSGYGRFCSYSAKAAHYGSKGMMAMLDGRSRQAALDLMAKNTAALIAKRDAQIIAALTKAGVTEIPEFELLSTGDGLEGTFWVAGKKVTIKTILAGGYNIQRLHNRTLVKVK